MEKSKLISSYQDLQDHIILLRIKKDGKEEALKKSITEFAGSLNPLSVIKTSLKSLAEDQDVRNDAATVGLKTAAHLLTTKLFGNDFSLKSSAGMLAANKLSAVLIEKGLPYIKILLDKHSAKADPQ